MWRMAEGAGGGGGGGASALMLGALSCRWIDLPRVRCSAMATRRGGMAGSALSSGVSVVGCEALRAWAEVDGAAGAGLDGDAGAGAGAGAAGVLSEEPETGRGGSGGGAALGFTMLAGEGGNAPAGGGG
jgi:hypothetical protein